jgi:hypothetical protein
MSNRLYRWEKLNWQVYFEFNDPAPVTIARCPVKECACKLIKSKEKYEIGEFKYECPKCGFKITLNKSIDIYGADFLIVYESFEYKDAEIINLDGELVRITREKINDTDYWIDAKLSKNKKGEKQLMVLAGSKKEEDKIQLFIDPMHEKLSFDQNNDHPSRLFSKVVCTFKNSEAEMHLRDKEIEGVEV